MTFLLARPGTTARSLGVSRRWGQLLLVLVLATPLFGFGSFESLFAPSKDLWRRWTANDPASGHK
jgi:hypothetical protein